VPEAKVNIKMIKKLLACFSKSAFMKGGIVDADEFVSHEVLQHDETQADYDQVNAMNLFYDMAVPTMLGLKGDYLLRKDLMNLYQANFVTAANRKLCLGIIKLQLNGMCGGEIRADATALAEAQKYAPLINTITAPTTSLPRRMEAMMAWAMSDKARHAVLIYKIYDQLFAQCKMQSVPSLRLGIPYYLIDRHGADEALRIWRNTSATARNHPSGFDRYRYFLEAIWLPYVSSHEPVAQAILDELHAHFGAEDQVDGMPQAYMELGEAMCFSPSVKLDVANSRLIFSYCIKSKTVASCLCYEV
jgi:hypothetical protein